MAEISLNVRNGRDLSCGTSHARQRAAAAAPLGKSRARHLRPRDSSTRTSIALRARAGGVPQVGPRCASTTRLVQVKGWLLTMSSESCCCFCIVSAHLIADIGARGSHIPPVMHHAGLAHAHVDANAAETTDACSHARFSCTGSHLTAPSWLSTATQTSSIHRQWSAPLRDMPIVCVVHAYRRAASSGHIRLLARCARPSWAFTWPQTCILTAVGPSEQQQPLWPACVSFTVI